MLIATRRQRLPLIALNYFVRRQTASFSTLPTFSHSQFNRIIISNKNIDSVSSLRRLSSTLSTNKHMDPLLASYDRPHWEAKLNSLSKNSQPFQALSLEERLDLVHALIERMEALTNDKLYENDMVVWRVAPEAKVDSKITNNYSNYAKRFHSYTKFGVTSFILQTLMNIKKNLEYRIALEQNQKVSKPALLSRKRTEIIQGREIQIYGKEELFPFLHKIEVWAGTGTAKDEEMGKITHESSHKMHDGGVTLLLGAGNQSLVTIYDALYCIFYKNAPVLVKHHPLRPHLMSLFDDLFLPLIERGYLEQIVDGGIPETTDILNKEAIKHVHLTGALKTSESIKNTLSKTRGECSIEEIDDMVTSELGCATPFIFAPSNSYSIRELSMAAKHIITGKKMNGGCNCVSPQVVVIPSSWKQKDEFKDLLLQRLKSIPNDACYYTGTKDKVESIVSNYKSEQIFQTKGENIKRKGFSSDDDFVDPYLIDTGVYGNSNHNNVALKEEAFGPLLSFVELQGELDENYLNDIAVPFVNNKDNIFGSLSCSLIYPKRYDKKLIDEATCALNYGCIGLNTWTGYGYFSICAGGTWGANKFDKTGESGNSYVGNLFEIPNVEKTVISSRSLTFPLVIDKMFMPPRLVTEAGTSLLLSLSSLVNRKKKHG